MHLLDIVCQGCIILMVAARVLVFHVNLLLICVTLQCVVSFQPYHWLMSTAAYDLMLGGQCKWYPNYSIKEIPTLLDFSSLDGTVLHCDFSSLDGTVCYTVISAVWMVLCVTLCSQNLFSQTNNIVVIW